MDRWGTLAGWAASRDGVFSVDQAAALGVDRRRIHRAVMAGFVTREHPRVFRFSASPRTRRAVVRAAALQVADGVATHESCLVLHRVPRVPLVPSVTVGSGASNHHQGIRIHRLNDLGPEHLTTIDEIPTTTLPRAVVDVTSVFGPRRLADLVDHLTITSRSTTTGAIARTLRQVNRRGRIHIARLGTILDARSPGEPAPRSRLERRADELLARTHLPPPRREHPLPSSGGYAGFVDRAWEDARLILEIDGRTWHAREEAMARDRTRERAAARVGWVTMRILDEELDTCGALAIEDIEVAYRTRLEQLHRAA